MQASAFIFERGDECGAVTARFRLRVRRDGEEIGDIHFLSARWKFQHVEAVNRRCSGGGQCSRMGVGRSQFRGDRGALHGHQDGMGVVGFEPFRVVFDLGEMRIDRFDFLFFVPDQRDPDIQGYFLMNENGTRVADKKIDRVMHRAARGVLHGNKTEGRASAFHFLKYGIDRGTRG